MILAGGAGTRFWPASRRALPKHLIPLLGETSLFEATLRRLRELAPPERTWVVSAQELARPTRAALRGHRGVRLLLEPQARNTAAAIAWVAARIEAADPGALMAVFPADHHIPAPRAFARSVRAAARAASDGEWLVLVGIEPTRPDTAYGYLRLGERVRGSAHAVQRFVEKPTASRARRFLRDGHYLWNAGMLVASSRRVLAEAEAHAPELWKPLGASLSRIAEGGRVAAAGFARAYRRVRPVSFDYAVLERTSRALAVRGRFRWSDLGSWDALEDHLEQREGNAVAGTPPVALVEASGNVIWNTTDKAVALLGVRDLVIVETRDALLICPKDRAQEVRQVVGRLARDRRQKLI
ncbi:MAG: mannose-1-phosphate guanylyltransferase [Deltaproteobacteria bacterium]|nr:mannose-1-phosphate guanylyltransferase [Deltaproteobacteria bacterium]